MISSLFPIEFPPKYTPEAAMKIHPQPEWYLLWVYQILKIQIFEGPGVRVALFLFMLLTLVIIFWPFIDRSNKVGLLERPIQTTLGIISTVEILILTYWALITPGKVVSVDSAFVILVIPALVIAGIIYLIYRWKRKIKRGEVTLLYEKFIKTTFINPVINSVLFILLIGLSSVALAHIVNALFISSINFIELGLMLSIFITSFGLILRLPNIER